MLSIVFLIAPLLLLGIACVVCLYLISTRHHVAAADLAPNLGSYVIGSGIIGVVGLGALIAFSLAVLHSPQAPLALLFTPWAFAFGSSVGSVWWLLRHWSVPPQLRDSAAMTDSNPPQNNLR